MRVLVTGGAGFIGAHLCRQLLADGHHVICLDNFSTGSRDSVSRLKMEYSSHFSLLERDIIEPLPADLEVDQIYNLACPASPPHYQLDPIQTALTSSHGAHNVLELARQSGAVVLQASTSEVYGDPLVHPQPEGYWGHVNPHGERSCYDEGKRFAESLFFDYHRRYGVQVRIIRIFNTYGPGMRPDDGRVVSNFIMQALRDEDLTIYGTGSQTRSFQYVDDCVDGLVRLMNNQVGMIGPVNIGNPKEFTILELAQAVKAMLPDSSSQVIQLPLPADDPRQRQPDISLAERELGWRPTVSLAEGLVPTIDFFTEEINRSVDARALVSTGSRLSS